MNSYEIFDNGYSRSGTEHIYMNRPGRANIDLGMYGMGANLLYDVQMFDSKLPLKAEIHKFSELNNSQFVNPDKVLPQKIYFSQ